MRKEGGKMKMYFRQRVFSWLDSYDVFDDMGQTVYTVQGKLAWGHRLHIHNLSGEHVATLKEVMLTFLKPRFDMFVGEEKIGTITKELTLFKPKFTLDCNDWQVQGNFWEWDYEIVDGSGHRVAAVNKEIWKLTDTYTIDVERDEDALYALMVVLAIDAEKCSRND